MKSIISIFVILLFFSCTYTTVEVTELRPSEINLQGNKRIAIAEIQSASDSSKNTPHVNNIANNITTALVNSGQFEVLDRAHIQSVLAEHKLTSSGLIDENTSSELGRFIGAAALLYIKINKDEYTETMTFGKPWKDKNGLLHQYHFRNGNYTLDLTYRVIDTETAKILAVRTLSSSQRTNTFADNATPTPIDSDLLFKKALNEVTSTFIKQLAPYKETLKLKFELDERVPEINHAIAFFRIGEIEDGIKVLETIQSRPNLESNVLAKVVYDLGVAEFIRKDYTKSLNYFKQAMLLNPKSLQYQSAISHIKIEMEKAAQLDEQMEPKNRTAD